MLPNHGQRVIDVREVQEELAELVEVRDDDELARAQPGLAS